MASDTKAEVNQYLETDHRLQKISIHTAQLMIYPLLLALRLLIVKKSLFYQKTVLDLKNIDPAATFVLYANHQSKLDPLIICASLPFKTIRRLLPFRFFVENSYFNGPAKTFLNAMGGFPARYDSTRPYGLEQARTLMTTGQTIVIFPPGVRTREKVVKPGISILAAEPNTYLIPAHIDWQNRWHCQVSIGKPFKSDVMAPPEVFMQHVYDLGTAK